MSAHETLSQQIDVYVDPDRDATEQTSALNQVLLYVHSKKVPLKELVTLLGGHLVHPSEKVRQRGTLLFAEILTRLPNHGITLRSFMTLLTFHIERLKDFACAKEVLMGLWALISNYGNKLTTGDASKICKVIFEQVNMQALNQKARKYTYDTIAYLTQHKSKEVLAMEASFIVGFAALMDGEKDPRNLVTCFHVVHYILTHFSAEDIKPSIEELFEITSCYFPITFNAPKNDNGTGVSGGELVLSLRRLLAASDLMAEWVFPLLLEKLEADTTPVKLDTLQTLHACIVNYSSSSVGPFLPALWKALKDEVLGMSMSSNSSDNTTEAVAMQTVSALVAILLPDTVKGEGAAVVPDLDPELLARESASTGVGGESLWWKQLIEPFLEREIANEMRIPDTKQARLYAKLIAGMVGGSVRGAGKLLLHVWPYVKKQFYSVHVQPSQREAMLELMTGVVSKLAIPTQTSADPHPLTLATLSSASSTPTDTNTNTNAAAANADTKATLLHEIQELYSSSLMGGYAKARREAVQGLCDLTLVPATRSSSSSAAASSSEYLSSHDQIEAAVQHASTLLFSDPDKDVRRAGLQSLVNMAQAEGGAHIQAVIAHTLPFLGLEQIIQEYQQHSPSASAAMNTSDDDETSLSRYPYKTLPNVLNACVALCVAPAVFKILFPQLLSLLNTLMTTSTSSSSSSAAAAAAHTSESKSAGLLGTTYIALQCITSVVNTAAASKSEELLACATAVPSSILRALVPVTLGALASPVLVGSSAKSTQGMDAGPVPVPASEMVIDGQVLSSCTSIIGTISRICDREAQSALLETVIALFLDGQVPRVVAVDSDADCSMSTGDDSSVGSSFSPFTQDALSSASSSSPPSVLSTRQLQLVPLFTAVVASLRRDVEIARLDEVLSTLVNFILPSSSSTSPSFASASSASAPAAAALPTHTHSAIICVASLINKLPRGDKLDAFVSEVIQTKLLSQCILDASCSRALRTRALTLYIWLLKGLVMRNCPSARKLAVGLCDRMLVHVNVASVKSEQEEDAIALAMVAAEGFDVIMSDCKVALHRGSYAMCGIGVIYKQRFFSQVLVYLLNKFAQARLVVKALRSSSPSDASAPAHTVTAAQGTQTAILLAVSSMLKSVPRQVLLANLSTTLPLLIQSLSSPLPQLRISTLYTLSTLIKIPEVVDSIVSHLSTLVPTLLKMTTYTPSMRVRLCALVCLEAFTTLPYVKIHPFKENIIQQLAAPLADKKRAVRQQAVKCRNEWYVTHGA